MTKRQFLMLIWFVILFCLLAMIWIQVRYRSSSESPPPTTSWLEVRNNKIRDVIKTRHPDTVDDMYFFATGDGWEDVKGATIKMRQGPTCKVNLTVWTPVGNSPPPVIIDWTGARCDDPGFEKVLKEKGQP